MEGTDSTVATAVTPGVSMSQHKDESMPAPYKAAVVMADAVHSDKVWYKHTAMHIRTPMAVAYSARNGRAIAPIPLAAEKAATAVMPGLSAFGATRASTLASFPLEEATADSVSRAEMVAKPSPSQSAHQQATSTSVLLLRAAVEPGKPVLLALQKSKFGSRFMSVTNAPTS